MKINYTLKVALLLGTMALPMVAANKDLSGYGCPDTYAVLANANGLQIQPEGQRIRLTENVTIEGNCHLFGAGVPTILTINELCPLEVRVTSGSVLDLSGGTLQFGGNIVFVLEKGAEIYFGEPGNAGTLSLTGRARAGIAPDGNRLDLSQFNN